MTDTQREKIIEMRGQGLGYKKIAAETGVPTETVKSFCRRLGMSANQIPPLEERHACLNCGVLIASSVGHREKKFCSDRCRNLWWNVHTDISKRKSVYVYTCPYCRKVFIAYANAHRKYCSHACYIEDRFGGVRP